MYGFSDGFDIYIALVLAYSFLLPKPYRISFFKPEFVRGVGEKILEFELVCSWRQCVVPAFYNIHGYPCFLLSLTFSCLMPVWFFVLTIIRQVLVVSRPRWWRCDGREVETDQEKRRFSLCSSSFLFNKAFFIQKGERLSLSLFVLHPYFQTVVTGLFAFLVRFLLSNSLYLYYIPYNH